MKQRTSLSDVQDTSTGDVIAMREHPVRLRAGRKRRGLLSGVASMVLAMIATSPLAAADYRLSPGDVIEFGIAGVPEMHQKARVDLDGSVSLPLVGEVPASGKTIAALRDWVRSRIAQKEYRQHKPAVGGTAEVIWPDQVSLAVAEYRPVYLNGDVAKPGEQNFRPGMTVRQALSLAGGYDILRFRMDNPFLETADLRGAYETAWIDYAKEQARLWRIRTELGDATAEAKSDMANVPLSADLLARIKAVESGTMKSRAETLQNERKHLTGLIAQEDADIASFTKRHDTETIGAQDDETELKRIQDLNKTGTLPLVRVVEARRIALLSATQALQSEVEMQRAKTERETTRRKRETLDETTRLELLQSEQDSQTKLGAIQAKIQSVAEKLLYSGALKTQLARGTGGQPDLMLFRVGQSAAPVTEDTELQPGDTVEVALRVEHATGNAEAMR